MNNDIEKLIEGVLRAEAGLDQAELSYLDADTSHDLEVAKRAHEAAVYAHAEADDMLDAALDEVPEFAPEPAPDRRCPQCHDPIGAPGYAHCGYCSDLTDGCGDS